MSSMLRGGALKVSSRSLYSAASGSSMHSHRHSLCAAAKHRLTSASSVESVLPLVVTRVLIAETIVHASTICLRVRRRRSRLPCPGGGAPRALPGRTGDQPCLLPRLQSRTHPDASLILGRGCL